MLFYSLLVLALSLATAAVPAPVEHSGGFVRLEPADSSFHVSLVGGAPVVDATTPQLLTCQNANCVGCTSTLLSNVGVGNCFWTGAFTSVEILDPSRVLAPGLVDVAPDNCSNWLAIPQQGICYNLIGATFHQWGTDRV